MADNSISGILAQIDANRGQYRQKVETLNTDRNLSAEGRRRAIQAAKQEADERHRQLREAHKEAVEIRRQQLYAAAFRPLSQSPDQQRSYRDAYDRAEAAKSPAELAALRDRARRTGDYTLLHATQQLAYDTGAFDVLDGDNIKIRELLDFDAQYGPNASAHQKMANAVALTAPTL